MSESKCEFAADGAFHSHNWQATTWVSDKKGVFQITIECMKCHRILTVDDDDSVRIRQYPFGFEEINQVGWCGK